MVGSMGASEKLQTSQSILTFLQKLKAAANAKELEQSGLSKTAKFLRKSKLRGRGNTWSSTAWVNSSKLLGAEPTKLIISEMLDHSSATGNSFIRWQSRDKQRIYELHVRFRGAAFWTLKVVGGKREKILWIQQEASVDNILHQLAISGAIAS